MQKKNEVTVGKKNLLLIKKIYLKNINFLGEINESENIYVKVRSTGRLIKSKIKKNTHDQAEIFLEEKEEGVSPGQACVFYSKDSIGDKVLGGGWIAKTVNKYLSP